MNRFWFLVIFFGSLIFLTSAFWGSIIFGEIWFLIVLASVFYGIPSVFIILKCLYWNKKSRIGIGYWKQWFFLFATNLLFLIAIAYNDTIRADYVHFINYSGIPNSISKFFASSIIFVYASDFLIRFSIPFIIIGLLKFNGDFISRGKYWLAKLKGEQPNEKDYAPQLKTFPFLVIFCISFVSASLIFFGYGPIPWIEAFCHPLLMIFPIILTLNFVVGLILKILLWSWGKFKPNAKNN